MRKQKPDTRSEKEVVESLPEVLKPFAESIVGETIDIGILGDYRISELVEDEGMAPWLVRFERAIASEPHRTAAWKLVEIRCDRSALTRELYFFTSTKQSRIDKSQDAHHALKEPLDELIKGYKQLLAQMHKVDKQINPVFGVIYDPLAKHIEFLSAAEKELHVLRNVSARSGSYKINPKDRYLCMAAVNVEAGTGGKHIPELVTLIEAAQSAHGRRYDTFTVAGITKRIERYKKRNAVKPVVAGKDWITCFVYE